jgi:cytochrome c-type biogenesis protein CcmH
MKRIVLTVGLSVLVSAVAVALARAQGEYPTDDDVNRIAKNLYCPVCPNTALDVCETKACQDWRAQIRDQLAAGWTEEQVVDYFVAQYGERVLAEPRRKGFTSLVWVLPAVAALAGIVVGARVLANWRSAGAPTLTGGPAPPAPEIPPEVLGRIEHELKRMG